MATEFEEAVEETAEIAAEDVVEETTEETIEETADTASEEVNPVDELAREMGWVPADEWKGDEGKHVSSAEFIKRGPEINKKTMRNQDAALAEMRKTMERMVRASERAEQRARETDTQALQDQRREAIETGDVELVEQIDERIAAVSKPEEPAEEVSADPDFDAWQASNTWYNKDVFLTAKANSEIAPVIRQMHPDATGAEFYELVAKHTREAYPEKFENPNRKRAPVTGAPANTRRPAATKGYEQMDPAAQAVCTNMVNRGETTREEYVKEYWKDEA